MKERLSPKHECKLAPDALEKLLYSRRVANKGRREVQPGGRNRTKGRLDAIWDPLNEIRRVSVLGLSDLIFDFFYADLSSVYDFISINKGF